MIYNTIIRPHYQYCCTILYLLNDTQKKRLQILQNKAMRVILKCNRYTPINLMLKTLKWLSIAELINYFTLLFIFKIKNKEAPSYFRLVQNNDYHSYPTRRGNNFRCQLISKESTKRNVFVDGILLFNSLPNEVKNAINVRQFKIKYLKFLKNKEYVL
jgi:hypothetical protein